MKKLLFILCCVFAASTIYAQRVTFGVKAGVNFATHVSSYYDSYDNVSSNSLTAFHGGVFVNVKQDEEFSLQPALLYMGKGANYVSAGVPYDIKMNYLQLPVNFLYTKSVSAGEFFMGFGPYIAYGLSASVQQKNGGTTYSEAVNFGPGENDFKRIDAGAGALAGFKFKPGMLISVNYDFGFTNVYHDKSIKTRNQLLGLSLGYSFGRK